MSDVTDWSSVLANGNFIQILVLTVGFFISQFVLLFSQIKIGFLLSYNIFNSTVTHMLIHGDQILICLLIKILICVLIIMLMHMLILLFILFLFQIKLVWVIVFVSIWYSIWYHINFTNIYFVCFCFLVSVCVVHPLFICLGGYIFISIVSFCVCIVWQCFKF